MHFWRANVRVSREEMSSHHQNEVDSNQPVSTGTFGTHIVAPRKRSYYLSGPETTREKNRATYQQFFSAPKNSVLTPQSLARNHFPFALHGAKSDRAPAKV
jgi:hypothetical protein